MRPSGTPEPKNWLAGGYLDGSKVPEDPWGGEYLYFSPGENGPYDPFSLGDDRTEGGEGYGADISVWD